jgi:hypothetical protein
MPKKLICHLSKSRSSAKSSIVLVLPGDTEVAPSSIQEEGAALVKLGKEVWQGSSRELKMMQRISCVPVPPVYLEQVGGYASTPHCLAGAQRHCKMVLQSRKGEMVGENGLQRASKARRDSSSICNDIA